MSAGLWWRSWCFRWPLGGDEVLVADRWVADGELEDPVEQQAAAAGAAPVEAEHELVHVAGQVGGFRRALMGAQQRVSAQLGRSVTISEHYPPVLIIARAYRRARTNGVLRLLRLE